MTRLADRGTGYRLQKYHFLEGVRCHAEFGLVLLLAEHQVHHPTSADVWPRSAAVVEDIGVVAPGVLKGVRQDRHGAEVAGVVHLLRQ